MLSSNKVSRIGKVDDMSPNLVYLGVNFTGAIVLTRYGGNFRGIKVRRGMLSSYFWIAVVDCF